MADLLPPDLIVPPDFDERVAEFKRLIALGRYRPDLVLLAEAILDRAIEQEVRLLFARARAWPSFPTA